MRSYRSRAVPDSLVKELLDLARYAPSSMNGQPWCFVLIRKPEIKKELARIKNAFCPPEKQEFPADFLGSAPVIVLVCVHRSLAWHREIENGILAAAFLLVGARSRGLGSVYLSAYRPDEPKLEQEISRLLHLPDGLQPVSIIPLGFAAEEPPPKVMRPLEEMIRDD